MARIASNRPTGRDNSDTASTKMARISASIERPCSAARTRNFAFTAGSRFRMLTAVNAITSDSNASAALCRLVAQTIIWRAVGGIGRGSLVEPDRYSSTPAAQARPSAIAQTISD